MSKETKGKEWFLDELRFMSSGNYHKEWNRAVDFAIRKANEMDELSNVEYNRKAKIPKFIKNTMDLYASLPQMLVEEYYNDSTEEIDSDDIQCWIDDNFELLCRAWLDGYEVEEELKYYIELAFGSRLYKSCLKNPTFPYLILSNNKIDNDWYSELTEQEIKDIDERYWPFAVPVKEANHG